MKSSNKILATFFIIVFIIPFIMLLAFRIQIRNHQFVAEDYNNLNGLSSIHGKIQPYKIVKIEGPADGFLCKINPSNEGYYNYQNVADSVTIEYIGDTLLILYPEKLIRLSKTGSYMQIKFNLFLPQINKVFIKGVKVSIDSVELVNNPNIFFDLSNGATLELGRLGHSETSSYSSGINGIRTDSSDHSAFSEKRSGVFGKLNIRSSSNSKLIIGPYAKIEELNLEMKNNSSIDIDNQSKIDQIKGSVSEETKINANLKNIKHILELLTD